MPIKISKAEDARARNERQAAGINKNRSREQIASDQSELAVLKVSGLTNNQIVAAFRERGRSDYTHTLLKLDWTQLRKKWVKIGLPDVIASIQEELVANDYMLHTAWENYRQALRRLSESDGIFDPEDDVGPPLSIRKQAFSEVSYWWGQIVSLRSARSKVLGLTAADVSVHIDNRRQQVSFSNNAPPKAYIGFSPDSDWPDFKDMVVEGEVKVLNDQD